MIHDTVRKAKQESQRQRCRVPRASRCTMIRFTKAICVWEKSSAFTRTQKEWKESQTLVYLYRAELGVSRHHRQMRNRYLTDCQLLNAPWPLSRNARLIPNRLAYQGSSLLECVNINHSIHLNYFIPNQSSLIKYNKLIDPFIVSHIQGLTASCKYAGHDPSHLVD